MYFANLCFDYFYNFAAFVDATVRARAMRTDLHVTIRAFSQVDDFKRVVSSPG
jgi:hypothetical protein